MGEGRYGQFGESGWGFRKSGMWGSVQGGGKLDSRVTCGFRALASMRVKRGDHEGVCLYIEVDGRKRLKTTLTT